MLVSDQFVQIELAFELTQDPEKIHDGAGNASASLTRQVCNGESIRRAAGWQQLDCRPGSMGL